MGARSCNHVCGNLQTARRPLRNLAGWSFPDQAVLGFNLPAPDTEFTKSEAELTEQVRARLEQSVRGQMVSDVPIGAFLSSGLDSSTIVALMAQATRQAVRTNHFPKKYRVGEMRSTIPRSPPDCAPVCEHKEEWSSRSSFRKTRAGTWTSPLPIRQLSPPIWSVARLGNTRR